MTDPLDQLEALAKARTAGSIVRAYPDLFLALLEVARALELSPATEAGMAALSRLSAALNGETGK